MTRDQGQKKSHEGTEIKLYNKTLCCQLCLTHELLSMSISIQFDSH